MSDRETIARILAEKLWSGATFDDCIAEERAAFLNAADAVITALAATAGSAGAMRDALEPFLEAYRLALVSGQPPVTFISADDFERLAKAATVAAPQAQESHTCRPQYKMRELPDPDCKACTTVSRPEQPAPLSDTHRPEGT